MNKTKNKELLYTANGDPRGYIESSELRELWFHTGTRCNLKCPSCFEKSSPQSDRLEQLSFKEVKNFIDEALSLNVQRFAFTGGEPFVNKDFVGMLDYALDLKPCLVLTNGTRPLMNVFAEISKFKFKPNKLFLRVSIDYPDEKEHDRNRGQGAYKYALKSLRKLYDIGFDISVAGRCASRKKEYEDLLARHSISGEIPLVFFPELQNLGETPEITEHCMTTYKTATERRQFMCNDSKMVIKTKGKISLIPCTLVDDDESFNLGGVLKEAMSRRVILRHPRCYTCFSNGVRCSGGASTL